MKRFCSYCGQERKDGAAFCSRCGAPAGNGKMTEKDAVGYLLYRFAFHGAIMLPWLFAGNLSGLPLLLSGLMAAFIAVLFLLAAVSLAKCIHSFMHRSSSENPSPENQKGMSHGTAKASHSV